MVWGMEIINEVVVSFFSLKGILTLTGGTLLGFLIGMLPGLGQGAALTLVLPVAFVLPPEIAFIMFAAVLGSSLCGGSITSILLNTPGTVGNMTTLLDGYPMARAGQADRAIGIAAGSSIIGAIIGVVVLIITLPAVRVLLMHFGAQEYFWSVVISLIIIALAGMSGSFVPGLIIGLIGLLFSFIGFSNTSAVERFTGKVLYLWDGFPLIAIAIGTTAISELSLLQAGGASISKSDHASNVRLKDVLKGAFETLRYKASLGRSSVIGSIIGIIPGLGAVAATFVSYSVASFLDKKGGQPFGQGNPNGIVASEAANNAKDAGAMLPSLFLGIPGSPEHAILLMIFIIYGIEPGPGMGIQHMGLVWTIILAIALSNIIACLVTMFGGKLFSKITVVPITPVVAVTLPMSVVAVYVTRGNPWDIVMTGLFTLFGIMMKRTGYPLGPFIVGFVLGPLLEKNYYISMQSGLGDPLTFLHSPLSTTLAVLAILGFLTPVIIRVVMLLVGKRRAKSEKPVHDSNPPENIRKIPGRKDWIAFSSVLLVISILMFILSIKYGLNTSILPFVISLFAIVLLVMLILGELNQKIDSLQQSILGSFAGRGRWKVIITWNQIVPVLIWLAIFFALFISIGTLPGVFVFDVYLMHSFGKYPWLSSSIVSLIITCLVFFIFEIALNLQLWPGAVPELIPGYLGGGFLPPLV
jgi:putative tricarboxylic transport membrane protein